MSSCHLVIMSALQLVSYTACQLYSMSALQLVSSTACQLYSMSALQLVSSTACQLYSLSALQLAHLGACELVSRLRQGRKYIEVCHAGLMVPPNLWCLQTPELNPLSKLSLLIKLFINAFDTNAVDEDQWCVNWNHGLKLWNPWKAMTMEMNTGIVVVTLEADTKGPNTSVLGLGST